MKVAIIDYKAGNVQSLRFALEKLGIEALLTDNAEDILSSDKIIFPGVGQADSAMNNLRAGGLIPVIKAVKQPFLGICLGMQLLCAHSEEGPTSCLDIVPVNIKKFEASGIIRVPHMGWNNIHFNTHPLFNGIENGAHFYFVHSYYAAFNKQYTIAEASHGINFSAALQKDNYLGVQFHPEKSAEAGLRVLQNFLEWPCR
jgi:glutamine amidotransferase